MTLAFCLLFSFSLTNQPLYDATRRDQLRLRLWSGTCRAAAGLNRGHHGHATGQQPPRSATASCSSPPGRIEQGSSPSLDPRLDQHLPARAEGLCRVTRAANEDAFCQASAVIQGNRPAYGQTLHTKLCCKVHGRKLDQARGRTRRPIRPRRPRRRRHRGRRLRRRRRRPRRARRASRRRRASRHRGANRATRQAACGAGAARASCAWSAAW